MGRKTTQHSNKKAPQVNRHRRIPTWVKWLIGVILTILVIVALYVFNIFYSHGVIVNTETIRQDMQTYLESRYGKKFIVDKVYVNTSGIGNVATYDASAHPENDETLRFGVTGSYGKYPVTFSSKIGYIDSLIKEYWTNNEKKRLDPLLKKIYGNDVQYTLLLGTNEVQLNTSPIDPLSRDAVMQPRKKFAEYLVDPKNIPTIEEVEKRWPGGMSYTLQIQQKVNQSEVDRVTFAHNLTNTLSVLPQNVSIDYDHYIDVNENYGLSCRSRDGCRPTGQKGTSSVSEIRINPDWYTEWRR